MNHLLIISPSLKAGGIERALTVLANEFVNMGIKVSFIACLPGEQHYPLDTRVDVYRSQIPYGNRSDKVLFYLRLLYFLRRQAKRLQPDRVLSFGDVFNPLVLLALYGLKYPIYISDRTSPDFRINRLAALLKKWLYPRATGMIAQTARAAKIQQQRYGKRLNIRVIPNAVQLIETVPGTERSKSILYVGRLSWEKGVDRLIKAFAMISDTSGWQLDIVGDGPERENLRELANTLKVQNDVVFHGLVKDPTPWYGRASVFVLPSHVEGFPNALVEAMSAGLPVVCFASIPHEAIIEESLHGCIVPTDDIEALSLRIKRLITDSKLRSSMSANNQMRAKAFEVSKITAMISQFMRL